MRVLIHLGLNKCGSTYIQTALADARARLARNGVAYPLEPGRIAQGEVGQLALEVLLVATERPQAREEEQEAASLEEERVVETGFGAPAAPVRLGKLAGVPVAFLPRHGAHHEFTPTEVPYRANIYAFKTLGVTRVISTVSTTRSRRSVESTSASRVCPSSAPDAANHRPVTASGRGAPCGVWMTVDSEEEPAYRSAR